MKVGSLNIEILSEGRFEMFRDGHINRAPEEDLPEQDGPEIATQSSIVGINPILVQQDSKNILLDTGLGWGLDAGSGNKHVSNVRTNLSIFGLEPADITHVILSHLHYDHAAGSSYSDNESKTRPTFPNATYYLHQKEWDYALSQINKSFDKPGPGYQLDDFYRLIADGHITLLQDNQTEITEGISAILSGGHTAGHQIVHLMSNDESAYYLSDLLPTSSHLNNYSMRGLDLYPLEAKKQKVQLLNKAYKEQAILLFYHSKHSQSGRLIKDDDKQFVLADIPKG